MQTKTIFLVIMLFLAACSPMSVRPATDTTRVYLVDNCGERPNIVESELVKRGYALYTGIYPDLVLNASCERMKLRVEEMVVVKMEWVYSRLDAFLTTAERRFKPWQRGAFENALREAISEAISKRN